MIDEYIERVENAIKLAVINTKTKLQENQFLLEGMSSRENRILLNELVREGDKYLEIGVHKGSTFVSALYKNSYKHAVAIDNFSQFGDRTVLKKWFDQNCEENEIRNYTFLERDCFNLFPEDKDLIKDTNVYFYDGDHTEEDQKKALIYYYEFLANEFLIIIDDYNHAPVQFGTKGGIDYIRSLGGKIHKEWILNSSVGDKGWHNGLYLAVVSK